MPNVVSLKKSLTLRLIKNSANWKEINNRIALVILSHGKWTNIVLHSLCCTEES